MKKTSNQNTRRNRYRIGILACTLVLTAGLTACGGESAIDQPPTDIENQMLQAVDGNPVTTKNTSGEQVDGNEEANANLTVYLKDRYGYLAPVSYQWGDKDTEGLANAAVTLLTEGSTEAGRLPTGFTATLPKGTQVKNMTFNPEQKLVVLELSKEFANYAPEDERSIMESLTWTLTSLPDVEQVQLWMDSKKLTEMPVGHTPLDTNLTRHTGINLEKDDTVSYYRSMPVQLYFTSLTEEGKTYYIPITRLVEPSDDIVTATINELIEGPHNKTAMSMVATDQTKISKIEHKEDSLVVHLSDPMFEQGDKVPADLLKSVIFSLTELSDVDKVQITMNGQTDILGSDDIDYSKPVTRPSVNPMIKG
ncbi:GerMN domain-containing protein [Paenibacillus sp. 1001270B_150601_E10]|uniref:GerMN domain-containing protein n=1 Tax=Paenibacillus sp. 1001270B_150601_E10 TaxID=2787079 RepID=UPI00189DD805|nr:GerMN domain-containing protein [Paenibacillus sp. 1001270B_150601_E10]